MKRDMVRVCLGPRGKRGGVRSFSVLCFVTFLACAAVVASGATIYVDVSNPTPPGDGSAGNPYNAIFSALQALAQTNSVSQGGHMILVQAGTYTEEVVFTNGHSGITNYPNTLQANGDVRIMGKGVVFCDSSNIVVNGITVVGAPTNGFFVTGEGGTTAACLSDYVTLSNCVAVGCSNVGIYVGNILNPTNESVVGFTAVRCRIYDNSLDGVVGGIPLQGGAAELCHLRQRKRWHLPPDALFPHSSELHHCGQRKIWLV